MSTAVSPSAARRVALVVTGLEPGGAEKCVLQLALGIDRARFHVEVYTLQPLPSGERGRFVHALREAGIPVHSCQATSWLATPRVLRQLTAHFRRFRPEVVQCFLYHANVIGTLAARWAGVPRVYQGIRVAEPSWRRRIFEHSASYLATAQVFVSKAAHVRYGASQQGIVIANGITMDPATSESVSSHEIEGLPRDVPLLLSVGRLHRQKGYDWLLDCLPEVFASVPHHLAIVGEGPERERLQSQARRLGIADRVHFLGWRPDVPMLLQRADLLVLASRYEGMPNAVLEAMAARCPVIATRVEGVDELLGRLRDRCSVPYGDSRAMIARLVELAQSPDLRAHIREKLFARAQKKFSLSRMIRRYEQLWSV